MTTYSYILEMVQSCTSKILALCGFANPSSIGIQVAGLRAMAPERGKEISETVFRAFIAGVFVTSMNACVAGSLLSTK